jgi:hypothetical protein
MTDRKLSTSDIARAAERQDAAIVDPAAKREGHPLEPHREPRPEPRQEARPGPHPALFPDEEVAAFRTRWEAIQTGFVDEPRTAVSEADALVAHVVTRVAEVFSRERTGLEQQWGRGDKISTEDLRLTLQRYRAFFDRLLSV